MLLNNQFLSDLKSLYIARYIKRRCFSRMFKSSFYNALRPANIELKLLGIVWRQVGVQICLRKILLLNLKTLCESRLSKHHM